jgi:hypothetical protein
MSLSPVDRVRFVNAYTRSLITAWSSEEYSDLLARDPRCALVESGVALPADSVVDVVRDVPDDAGEDDIDMQVELYEQGLRSGRFVFRIPLAPRVRTVELSDGDLDAVHAGVAGCSCSPCCCST